MQPYHRHPCRLMWARQGPDGCEAARPVSAEGTPAPCSAANSSAAPDLAVRGRAQHHGPKSEGLETSLYFPRLPSETGPRPGAFSSQILKAERAACPWTFLTPAEQRPPFPPTSSIHLHPLRLQPAIGHFSRVCECGPSRPSRTLPCWVCGCPRGQVTDDERSKTGHWVLE